MTGCSQSRTGMRITQSFRNLPRPHAQEIGSAGPGDYDSIERRAVIEFFSRYAAEELNSLTIKAYKGDKGAAMHFMSGKAVAYFLPAFMEIYLENEADIFNIAQSIMYVLSNTSDNRELYNILHQAYSADQKIIIREVLTAMDRRLAPDGIGPPPLPSDIRDRYWS